MGRTCSICAHENALDINEALGRRVAKRRIAAQYGLSPSAVRRHYDKCFFELLARATEAQRVADADSLLDRVERLYMRAEGILDAAEADGEKVIQLAAIRELRGTLELLGRVTKELQTSPTLNLSISPEWVELRGLIVEALGPYREARAAVLGALERR